MRRDTHQLVGSRRANARQCVLGSCRTNKGCLALDRYSLKPSGRALVFLPFLYGVWLN